MTGPEGKSAYDSWLSSGEVGTEKEFLFSLIGANGVKGDKGDTGDKGDKGDPGLDGLGLGDVTGGASSVITQNLDTSRVLVSNLVGKISASGIFGVIKNTLLINFDLSDLIAFSFINLVPPFATITGSSTIFFTRILLIDLTTASITFVECSIPILIASGFISLELKII